MLESRRRAQIDQMIQPIICQLYSHLQTSKQQIQNSVDMYYKVIMSGLVRENLIMVVYFTDFSINYIKKHFNV